MMEDNDNKDSDNNLRNLGSLRHLAHTLSESNRVLLKNSSLAPPNRLQSEENKIETSYLRQKGTIRDSPSLDNSKNKESSKKNSLNKNASNAEDPPFRMTTSLFRKGRSTSRRTMDMKKKLSEEELKFYSVLDGLNQQRIRSLRVQKKILEKSNLHLSHEFDLLLHRIEELVHLKEEGVQLETMMLKLEKKYENIFVRFDEIIENIKNETIELLNRQRRELFSSILSEKVQNQANFLDIQQKIKDKSPFNILIGGSSPSTTLFPKAFKCLKEFSMDFEEEFLNMISSRFTTPDLTMIKEELNSLYGDIVNKSLHPPTAFPTELIRFFQQKEGQRQSRKEGNLKQDLEGCIQARMGYPDLFSIRANAQPMEFDFKTGNSSDEQGKESRMLDVKASSKLVLNF